jgi:hypothetical protein
VHRKLLSVHPTHQWHWATLKWVFLLYFNTCLTYWCMFVTYIYVLITCMMWSMLYNIVFMFVCEKCYSLSIVYMHAETALLCSLQASNHRWRYHWPTRYVQPNRPCQVVSWLEEAITLPPVITALLLHYYIYIYIYYFLSYVASYCHSFVCALCCTCRDSYKECEGIEKDAAQKAYIEFAAECFADA